MKFQRFLAWSGIACVAMFFGAFVLASFVPPLKPHDSALTIATHYQEHTTGIRIGGVVMLIGSMFYATFTAVISAQMRRIPGVHIAAVYTQLAAGAFACLTFLVPAMLLEVVAFRPDRDIATTQALNDMFWIFLVMPWPPFMAQNYAFAYAIFTDPRERPLFPRWLAYVNIWCPLMFSPAILLPFFKSGPFSWAGIFVMWIPAFVFIGQFVANTTMLLRAIGSEEREVRTAPARAPAVVAS
jgi:uncharacterized membrane protein YidH (DUF202 family)